MVRRVDLLNKTKKGRILRASPVVEEVVDEVIDLESLTFNELRALCKERGLDAKGKKADLIAKLSDSPDGDDDEGEEE
tara:strand:- start:595 stop:828 length:234 start_codon:yes stop_codon:yes gene_type:complete